MLKIHQISSSGITAPVEVRMDGEAEGPHGFGFALLTARIEGLIGDSGRSMSTS